jgi:hypothetical protein
MTVQFGDVYKPQERSIPSWQMSLRSVSTYRTHSSTNWRTQGISLVSWYTFTGIYGEYVKSLKGGKSLLLMVHLQCDYLLYAVWQKTRDTGVCGTIEKSSVWIHFISNYRYYVKQCVKYWRKNERRRAGTGQVVSRRPLTAENRLRNQTTARGIYVGRSGTWTGFSARTSILRTVATQWALDINHTIFRPILSN